MKKYKTRKIQYKELIEINDWKIKIYTISKVGEFNHPIFYRNVINELPKWLNMQNSFDSTNDKVGFLILHSGSEGIFSLINWWVGKNMLKTKSINHEINKFQAGRGGLLGPSWTLQDTF